MHRLLLARCSDSVDVRGHADDSCGCLVDTVAGCTKAVFMYLVAWHSDTGLPVDSLLQDHSLGLHMSLAYSVPLQVVGAVCKVAVASRHLRCRRQGR
jgi:hypothetical protein